MSPSAPASGAARARAAAGGAHARAPAQRRQPRRHGDARPHEEAPTQATGRTRTAPPAPTQAAQEAEALDDLGAAARRARRDAREPRRADPQHRPDDERARPSAPAGTRVSVTPMTVRRTPRSSWPTAATTPPRPPTTSTARTRTTSTSSGPARSARSRATGRSSSAARTQRRVARTSDIMGTLVHESQPHHRRRLRRAPGDGKTDAASFDRYRDEFRAYFVEPNGPFTALARRRARLAIRNHMCGASAGAGTYADLRQRVLGAAAGHQPVPRPGPRPHRPDGFNLDNSPYLDRLVHLLRDQQAGRATRRGDALPDHGPLAGRARRGRRRDPDHVAARPPARSGRAPASAARSPRPRRSTTAARSTRTGARASPPSSRRSRRGRRRRSPRPTASAGAHDRGDLHANAHFLSWLGRVLPSEHRDADLRHLHGPGALVRLLRARPLFWRPAQTPRRGQPMPEPLRARCARCPSRSGSPTSASAATTTTRACRRCRRRSAPRSRAILRGDADPP